MATVISFSSGKGGVGKTVLLTNMAYHLAQVGKRVLVIDADLGLANVDIMYGLKPIKTLQHCLMEGTPIHEVILIGPGGTHVVAAANGAEDLTRLTPAQRMMLIQFIEDLAAHYDFVFLDNGAGIGENVLFFASASHMPVIVVMPEPTSFMDAYALIKVLSTKHGIREVNIMMNRLPPGTSSRQAYLTFQDIAYEYLPVNMNYLGQIPSDPDVATSVRRQKPFVQLFPESPASRQIVQLSEKLLQLKPEKYSGNLQFVRSLSNS